ncbi:glutamate carboxypeptidase 2 [Aplysia californica]|uniref:Glutamate carboxypeptidase 2 n=1 Tax=Aplysia californica TaxID=6500 RepID=A0ABM0JZJ9_APLCA|nr:glutamate carboxypeptidase 2 [Aplysia californica]
MMRGFDTIESMNADEVLVKRKRGTKRYMVAAAVIGGLFFIVGIMIGYFSHKAEAEGAGRQKPNKRLEPDEFIIEKVSKEFLDSKLRMFSSKPRLAGTKAGTEIAETIKSLWSESGLDEVHMKTYNVLLSLPNASEPNMVEVINKTTGEPVFTSQLYEAALRPEDNTTLIVPFAAYSPAGIVEGNIVHVNYGTTENIESMLQNLTFDLTGTIFLAKYGQISPKQKVQNAELYGASALLLYPDLADTNGRDNANEKVYPDSWLMPDSGVRREMLLDKYGDPDTPNYPSTEYAHYINPETRNLPKIPCQPISYHDAVSLLEVLTGSAAPQYGVVSDNGNGSALEVRVTVNNILQRRPIHNVIGIIKGSIEPDRFILLGGHHDSWTYGAVDPHSASAVLSQIVHLFGQLLQSGHRPRRTLVFCSWDAKEPAIIGSTEWVEENEKLLSERAVAYLNADLIAGGHFTLSVKASPLLQDALFTAAKRVPSHVENYKTLYDLWAARPNDESWNSQEPKVSYAFGSDGDYVSFHENVGISSADFSFTYEKKKFQGANYPLHHTAYDTYYLYKQFQDPNLACMEAGARFWGILANNLANAPLLPLRASRLSSAVSAFLDALTLELQDMLDTDSITLDAVISAVRNFSDATSKLEHDMNDSPELTANPLMLRRYNDKLMLLERAFTHINILPGKEFVFRDGTPGQDVSPEDIYLYDILNTVTDMTHGPEQIEQLKEQISVIALKVQSAADSLYDIGLIKEK